MILIFQQIGFFLALFIWIPSSFTAAPLLRDLDGSTYSIFASQVNNWDVSPSTALVDTSVKWSVCGGRYLLGGYNILATGRNNYFYRSYDLLSVSHNAVSVIMTFQAIDSWDGTQYPGNEDYFQIMVGSETFNGWYFHINDVTGKICGDTNFDDHPAMQIFIDAPHSGNLLNLRIISQLGSSSTDESFGVRDIFITPYTIAAPEKKFCGVAPFTLTDRWCNCSTTKEYQSPVNSGTCKSCHSSCASCNGPSSHDCLSCNQGEYLDVTTCKSCHTTCATCDGGGPNQCTSCSVGQFLAVDRSCISNCSYPLNATSNNITKLCNSTCNINEKVYWDQSCSSNCDTPLEIQTIGPYDLCIFPAQPYDYLYWDKTSSADCDSPLAPRLYKNRRFCDYKCLTTEYLHWDATCRTSCNFPLNSSISHSRNFCTNPCKTSEYLYWNQSCITTCETPLQIRKDANDVYCDFPCLSNQVAYWDGTCSSSCLSPLVLKSEGVSMVRYFCLFPCKIDEFLYWNGTCSKACIPPLTYTYQNSRSFCHYPCTSVQYLYWNGSCQSSCSSPFSIRIEAGYKYCDYICSSSEYLFWNGSCLPTCKTPLVIRMQGADKFCDYPCNTNDFLYWNGTCSSQCLSPLFSKTEGTPSRKFCDYECANSDDYLYWNGSCAASCDLPFSIRLESIKKYCDYPCLRSSTIPQYLYWNGTCSSSCNTPLQIRVDSDATRYCDFPCPYSTDFLYWNGTCSQYCPSPLTKVVEGNGSLAKYFCSYSCNNGAYLYWNRSCVSTCSLPLRTRVEGTKQFCDQPCNNVFEYYYPDNNKCKRYCPLSHLIDNQFNYPRCLLRGIVEEEGWFTSNILTATAQDGQLTFIVIVKMMEYLRYLDIKMSPRLQMLVLNKGRNILSLKFGYYLSSGSRSNFIDSSSPYIFARRNLHSSFLVNFWENLTSAMIILLAAICFTILEKTFRVYNWSFWEGIFGRLRSLTKWSFLLILIGTNIDDVLLYSSQQFRTFSNSDKEGYAILSFVVCLVVLLMALGYIIGVFIIVQKVNRAKLIDANQSKKISKNHLEEVKNKWQDFQIFFRGFRSNSLLNSFFYPIYIIRLALPMLVASYLYKLPLVQMIFQVSLSVVILGFIIISKPLEKKINHLQLVVFEFKVLVMNICVLILTIFDVSGTEAADLSIVLGDIIIVGNISINVLIVFFLVIKVLGEANIIRRNIKGSSLKYHAAWVQLLAIPLQQGGMGFEEMMDEDKSITYQAKQAKLDHSQRDINTSRELLDQNSSRSLNTISNIQTMSKPIFDVDAEKPTKSSFVPSILNKKQVAQVPKHELL